MDEKERQKAGFHMPGIDSPTHSKPLIFDIVSGSYVDGPGLRTALFLKGCPLRCSWCHNPESQSVGPESFFYEEKCRSCSSCEDIHCVYGARKNAGIYYAPYAAAKMVLKNREYFFKDGGVTFSGGEPLMWPGYISEVCNILKKKNIHVAIDTCGYFDYDKCESLLNESADLVLFDIKIMNPAQHIRHTGANNLKIKSNFRQLYKDGIAVQPVIPLIPEITANRENLALIADFLADFDVPAPIFHPFHSAGNDKLIALDRPNELSVCSKPLALSEQKSWEDYFKMKMEQAGAYLS